MKFFIVTDSRGTLYAEGKRAASDTNARNKSCGWTHELIKKYDYGHEYHCLRSSEEQPTITLYQVPNFLETFTDNHFDLALIQVGYHEGIEYYTEGILKEMMHPIYNPDSLANKNGEMYNYINRKDEKDIFDIINKKCKRSVFIQQHSLKWYKHNSERNPTYNENVIVMNTAFSKLTTDTIALPLTKEWHNENVCGDGMHYNGEGITYILKEIEKFMENTMLKLVNEFLTSKDKPTVDYNDTLYSSGLLDSMDMMELMLFLNNKGERVNVTVDGSQLVLDEMDSVKKLEQIRDKE